LASGGVTPHLGDYGAIAPQPEPAALGLPQTGHHGPVTALDGDESTSIED